MSSSSSYTSKYKERTHQEIIDATHCECRVLCPVKEQVAWTPTNPARRFKACPKREKHKNYGFYGFLDPELPSEYYKAKVFSLYLEKERYLAMLNGNGSKEVNEVSNAQMQQVKVDATFEVLKVQMQQMKEELTAIQSKVYVNDKFVMFLSLVVGVIVTVIAISIMN
ncbi:hypothetical protein CTI12_AA621830 [Artemisia annua]|uniref:Zinc finger GRF-type domain-containing protein n=1 Tax=Artemisia annua TaxID=35608 RepID=A0A2U1KBF5_ARTAN|nr:hypothetical protein CTI12_AA621830 [Artemisia annua]